MDTAIDEFTINLAITIIVMVCALALVGGKNDERKNNYGLRKQSAAGHQ